MAQLDGEEMNIREYAGQYLEEMRNGGRKQSRIKLGIPGIDTLTGGFQPGNLIIIAARPSVGKSVLGLVNCAYMAAKAGVPTAVVSYEMSRREIMDRLVAHETGIDMAALRDGKLPAHQRDPFEGAIARIADTPLEIHEGQGATVEHIHDGFGRLNCKLMVVDYLQLVPPTKNEGKGSRVYEIEHVTKSFKQLAVKHQIPVVLLSQLSRDAEKEGRPPRLSDLRDSGAIEQDADLVLFIHRKSRGDGDHDDNGVLMLEKQRNGPTGHANVRLDKGRMVFRPAGLPVPEEFDEERFNKEVGRA